MKKGDIVECVEPTIGYTTKGKTYVVERVVRGDNNYWITIINDCGIGVLANPRFFKKVEETQNTGFDWFKTSWYIPIVNNDHLVAVVEFLNDIGYKFEVPSTQPESLFHMNITCLTNTYQKGNPKDFVLYSTDKDLSKQETNYGSIRVDLKHKYFCKIVDIEIQDKKQIEIRKIQEQIKKLNEKLVSLLGSK